MENKTLSILFASVLAVFMIATLVSADDRLSISVGSLSKSANYTNIIFATNSTSLINVSVSLTPAYISDANGNRITLQLSPATLLNFNETSEVAFRTVRVSYNPAMIPSGFEFVLGDSYSASIFAYSAPDVNISPTTLAFLHTYCEKGDVGSNVIIKDIADDTSGVSEWEWIPLTDVSLKVKVKNAGTDTEKITVKIGLYSTTDDSFIDLGEDTELEESLRLGDGKTGYYYFNFQIPEDTEEGDYNLYAKAYIDGDENLQCTSLEEGETEYSKEVSISYPDDGLEIGDLATPQTLACGASGTVTFKLFNFDLGDEQKFRVRVTSNELGMDQYAAPVTLDEGESPAVFSFKVNVSKYVNPGAYPFVITVEYEFNDNSNSYTKFNDDNTFSLTVNGNCITPIVRNGQIDILADQIQEEIKAGKPVVIKTTISNTGAGGAGTEDTVYRVLVEGVSSFATVKSISPSTITLKAGETKDVSITLNLKPTAEGEQTFNVTTTFEGKRVTQQVALSVTGYTTFDWMKDHWALTALIALIAIIVVIIVIVILVNKYA